MNLPAYQIIEFLHHKKVKVLIPDDEVDIVNGNCKLSKEKIRQKYRGQNKWDHPKVCDDVICDD